ncbi:hypothetical protein B0H14DRAFT_3091667 [Mycena olivaceomarginata]|nr:hypothetical protein B0H14DRAFT_3091667 [Mycena olivaceomarginata]
MALFDTTCQQLPGALLSGAWPGALDRPLQQWAEDHLITYLEEVLRLEGRGDHAYLACRLCGAGIPDHRCRHCLNGGELICRGCIVAAHAKLPFHIIEHWTGEMFVRKALKDLGLRIQLGHWHDINRACPVPTPAANDDFVVVDLFGVHEVGLDYCGCGRGGHTTVQLLRAQLWPATTTSPKTAATFAVLRQYQLLSFESKCSALEFYQSLARQTDNLGLKKGKKSQKDRYHEFLRMTREWRHVRMLKRAGRGHDPAGVANTKPGECALLCPACPQPGKNLPANWQEAPENKQYLYGIYLAIDANFRLKRKDVSTEERDPGLGNGLAFLAMMYAPFRSHCVAHDAVDKPDREARGTASSGIGAVDCARHNMKRPLAVGDLQLGERYLNMDYMFFRSIVDLPLIRFFVSYDIACQWHINIWKRLVEYQDPTITIDGNNKFFTFLVGQTDGEAPERGWANANPLARSTKEMGPGSRRDTLDDHFNDWNHKKIIAMGKKMEVAVPEMVKTREALADLEESLGTKVVEEWTAMALRWEADIAQPNPFETLRKDMHVAKVRAELAAEAAAREWAGTEDAGAVRGDMHITEVVGMGLQLEDQQYVAWIRGRRDTDPYTRRVLASDVASTGLHPTDRQRRAMVERTSKLRRKIVAWIDVQSRFFPGLKNTRVPGIAVSEMMLWLPSAIAVAREDKDVVPAVRDGVREVSIGKTTYEHEYRLRVGQAEEALHEVRRLLLVRTHVYKLKDTHSRGVRANIRSQDKIAALNGQVQRAAEQYRAARVALVALGGVLRRDEWRKTLLELKSDDVRGLPQATFHDPERKKTTKGKAEEEEAEAVRIEWAKVRARCHRWREEVDLLEAEMARVRTYLAWRAEWWKGQVGQRPALADAQLEGETAFALRQAAIQTQLADGFADDWKSLPDLVAKGRRGELEDEAVGDSDEEESDEEEAAIGTLPQREIKTTYVDEVLEM